MNSLTLDTTDYSTLIAQLCTLYGIIIFGLILYCINIIKLARAKDGTSGKNIVRTVGIFIPFIGIIMGFF